VFSIDVADPEACRAVVTNTLHRFGRIDGIVNNAAIVTPLAYIEDVDTTSWRYCMEVNMMGPFYMTKFALPALRRHRGNVINVSSGAANIPIEAASAYCASKAALTHFTTVLAAEEPSITAVAVRPGVVDTDMQAIMRDDGPHGVPPETAAYYKDLYTRGMLEPPEIPARSIAWLALNAPHEMTGAFRNYDDADIQGPAFDIFGP
jgi:NAD(P)-dependent dehydrogenase (short-subunit alcohol dehydrogenase family)